MDEHLRFLTPFYQQARMALTGPHRGDASDQGGDGHRVGVLDGWRGMSILLVMVGHMLPLGFKGSSLNEAVAAGGMAIFFILSGLLITRSLMFSQEVLPFIIKRLFRIVPLVYLFVLVWLAPQNPGLPYLLATLGFYANASEQYLTLSPHLWSLAVEAQFYAFAAAATVIFRSRWLHPVPLTALALAVTLGRVLRHQTVGIETLDRVDEILAGAALAAWIASGWLRPGRWANRWTIGGLFIALLFCTASSVRHYMPALAYARPYLAAFMVGAALLAEPARRPQFLGSPMLRYLARISFALYIIHRVTYMGWMGAGDTVERYAKRTIAIVVSFGLAHLSTRYFEGPITAYGHRLAKRVASATRVRSADAPA